MRAGLELVPRGEPQRCPFCHEGLELEDRQSCAGCGALYHRECLVGELGRCAVLGCGAPAEVESEAPFAGAVRQLLADVARELPGVQLGAPRPPWLRPDEQPLGRIGWGPDALVLTDRGVWRGEELCCDYAQIATVDWDTEGLRVRLGLERARGWTFLLEGDAPAPRLTALALERVLAPLAGYRAATLPDRCPLCLEPARERVLACEGCGVAYDPACLRARGGCVAPGCAGRRALPRPPRDWFVALGRPRPDVPLSPSRPLTTRCAECSTSFRRGDLTRRCEGCGAHLHESCLRDRGRCPTPGCQGTAAVACRYDVPAGQRGCAAVALGFACLVAAAGVAGGGPEGGGVLVACLVMAGLLASAGVALGRSLGHVPRSRE
ncbi:MAG: hypothetical protein R3F62_16010 [Planctomycetota bacterium]